jgi:hypothetical protein
MWREGQQDGDPSHLPLPQEAELTQNWQVGVESPVPTMWQRSLKMLRVCKKVQKAARRHQGRQEGAKGGCVTSVVRDERTPFPRIFFN